MVKEVQVVPGVVVFSFMVNQILLSSALQDSSCETADEALIQLVVDVDVLFSTQLSEGVDNNTENNIQ